jgi:hypothetical protein
MSGFHVVFRVRVNGTGKLAFWADDGCIITRNGSVVHDDKWAHGPLRGEIEVGIGDILQIAQWQKDGEWVWAARLIPAGEASMPTNDLLWTHYEAVLAKIDQGDGPPLKMFSNAATPSVLSYLYTA